jgi:N-acetylmuramoyl-L-alanine amidase
MKTIVLDLGHGGGDPGAVNKQLNVNEKDINLRVGIMVKEILTRRYECKVVMTREKDESLTLTERILKSNSAMADRFISIHCNSFKNESANGYEVWVHDKNNNLLLGQDILNSISKNIKGVNRGLKESKELYVLRHTKCKSCLIEIGFISNENECNQILDNITTYANAIANGIATNLKLSPKSMRSCVCECHK